MPRVKKQSDTKKKTDSDKTVDKVVNKNVVRKNNLSVPVFNIKGEKIASLNLPKEIFDTKINAPLIAQYIRVYLANQRQGTASTKTRGEVSGSTRKIYRQKGTGRARHGSIKAPIFIGGGIVGGPRPRDYSLRINKKQKLQALFSALTQKNKKNNIIALSDEFTEIKPKTKIFADFLQKLNLYGKKILLVLPRIESKNIILAARNIANLKMIGATVINPYEILRNNKILITEEAVKVIKKHFIKA